MGELDDASVEALLAQVAKMFDACETRQALSQALLVVLYDKGIPKERINELHKQAYLDKGWSS